MERSNFENLEVYKLSEVLADKIWDIALKWNRFAQFTVGVQIVKAADSIGANIVEGTGKGSKKDNQRFAKLGRGSLFETKNWLRRAVRHKLLSNEEINEIKPIVDELTPRLSAYINSIN